MSVGLSQKAKKEECEKEDVFFYFSGVSHNQYYHHYHHLSLSFHQSM